MRQDDRNPRPYRSHLQPACLACRKRRSRCQTEASSEACLTCQIHGTECVFPSASAPQKPRSRKSPKKRAKSVMADSDTIFQPENRNDHEVNSSFRRIPLHDSSPSSDTGPAIRSDKRPEERTETRQSPGYIEPSFLDDTMNGERHCLHVVSSARAKDNIALSDYISFMPDKMRNVALQSSSQPARFRPVLSTKVRRSPLGVSINQYPPQDKLTVIEKILKPYTSELIDLYFEEVHPCFPLLDEASFRWQFETNKDKISPALLANLYAHTVSYWDRSKSLASHPCPDQRYIWNLANDAIYSELLLTPEISIIYAILLNIIGRPATSLVGNGVLLASAVAVARSLGLNYTPVHWEISACERSLRMKLWWGLIVCDRWTSLAYGTPPSIHRWEYNVPQIRFHDIYTDDADTPKLDVSCIYVALAELSDLLYNLLQYIYDINAVMTRNPDSLDRAVNDWVDSLDGPTRLAAIEGANIYIPGASNLRLLYLVVRLLKDCMRLERDKQIWRTCNGQFPNFCPQPLITCDDILSFTRQLDPKALSGFWLPTSAFSYSLVVSFLLRTAFDAESSLEAVANNRSFKVASDLLSVLQKYREDRGWCIGDACIEQYGEIIAKIELEGMSFGQVNAGSDSLRDLSFLTDASIVEHFLSSHLHIDRAP